MAGYGFTVGDRDIWEGAAGCLVLLLVLGWLCAWPALLTWLKIGLGKTEVFGGAREWTDS